jgi:hypothetical protein
MKFITGIDRNQAVLFPVTLDETVDRDNEVRLIDMFVNSLLLQDFFFPDFSLSAKRFIFGRKLELLRI